MATQFYSTASIVESDRSFVWHPFTQMQTAHLPIPIASAKGVYLYDVNGRSYLDAISSWWVNIHGHTHPYIVEKIKAQLECLEHVIFAGFTHAPAAELAARLINILPGKMAKIFFSDNGSTAVEVALKMALQYWHNQKIERREVICFKNGYHGDTFGTMSAAGRNEFNRPFWRHLFDVKVIDPPFSGQEERSIAQLQSVLKNGRAACFIFEPLVQGSGGMMIYSAQGLSHLIRMCQENSVLTIADEVMTGFGRTGTLFACDQLSAMPDLICLSKGLTGGFLPLGATACTSNIFNAFLGDYLPQAFLHGHSYTANPLACTSALASLDLLLAKECALQRAMIATEHHNFCQQWHLHPKLKRCESLGTIMALEYESKTRSYFQPLRDSLYFFFLDKGILLRPLGNVLYIMPPYCINANELKSIYKQITHTLEGEFL